MKLVLGSVQFGKNYGLVDGKKILFSEIKKIEKIVSKSNIRYIDTSINYGDSEKIIGNSRLKKLNIITKLKLPKGNININKWVRYKLNLSLKRLKVKKIYGILVHDVNDVLKKNGKKYLKILYYFKKEGIIKNIGLSVYRPTDLKKIWKYWKPDIVQCPFNIFDHRFLKTKWFKTLKKNNIKIFVRSCFLQGLLISDYKSINKFKKYYKTLDKFSDWCLLNKLSRIKACLHFIKKHNIIDYLVVGYNNSDQLKQIINTFNHKMSKTTYKFSSNKQNLIDPRKW
jgi:aryl-alcohol dehydrogenase-like predicted oxidoreductase